MNKENIIKLLDLLLKIEDLDKKFERKEIDICVWEELDPNFDIFKIVLWEIWFPKDNSLEVFNFEKQEFKKWFKKEDLFSDEYLLDIIELHKWWAEKLYEKLLNELDILKKEASSLFKNW